MFKKRALALVILLVVLAAPALTQDTTTTLEQLRQYRIIYLVDPTSELAPEADSLRSPSKLEEDFGAIIANTWEEALEAHETAPLDALIIDVSALPLVETQLVTEAYYSSIVIGSFNIPDVQIAELVNNFRIANTINFDEDYEGEFYVTVSRYIFAENPDDTARLREYYSQGTLLPDIEGYTSTGGGKSSSFLEDDEDYSDFVSSLNRRIRNLDFAYEHFYNPDFKFPWEEE